MKTRTLLLLMLTLALTIAVSAFAFAASGEESACPLEQLQGASVRLDENHSGLRFESRIPTSELAALGDVTVGTLIFPTDRLTGELTVETAGALNLVGARPIEKSDGYTYFYAAIVDILPQNYTRPFTAVSYIKSGESYTYTESTSASIYGVSKAAYASKYAGNAIVRGYLDRVLTIDRTDMALVLPCQNYVSPYEVTYADGKITVTPKDGTIEESDIATFLIDGVAYTGGWHKSGETLVAPFKNEFTVTFSVQGESTSETYAYGETPAYTGSTDFRASDDLNYRIVGWDKAFAPVTGDVTYTAETLRRYELRWMDKTGNVTYQYDCLEGQVPVPPEGLTDDILSVSTVSRFTGWDRELTALSSDCSENFILYVAQYVEEARLYNVYFKDGDTLLKTVPTPYGSLPTFGEPSPEKDGYHYVSWSNATQPITGERTCEASFSVYDPKQLEWALTMTRLGYSKGYNDHSGDMLNKACALLFVLTEYADSPADNPRLPVYRDYVVKNLTYMVTDGYTPYFDLEPYWSYCNLTASIALSHEIPEIWDALSAEVRERYDFVMKCFAYVLAFGTADVNDYSTGPGMIGNFGKDWNPNFRLANVTPMIFIGKYFGGAAKVNEILHAFDFSDTVDTFREYGEPFSRALAQWSAEAPTLPDGSTGPTPEYFMENGGPAYLKARNDSAGDRLGITEGQAAGNGAGVRIDYTYKGYTLDEPEKILSALLEDNYSGGRAVNTCGKDESGNPYAYILDANNDYDKTACTPVIGLMGMMKELNTTDANGVRSSLTYCSEDFVMVCGSIAAAEHLGMYDLDARENTRILSWALVGNADYIYKYDTGYMSYSLGRPYVTRAPEIGMYTIWKSWWIDRYGDRTPEGDPDWDKFKPTLYDENFDFLTVDFKNEFNNLKSDNSVYGYLQFSADGKQGSSETGVTLTTVDQGLNRLLRFVIGAGAGDPSLNFCYPGGLAAALRDGNADTLTISLALSKESGYDVLSGPGMRLRASGSSDVIYLLSVNSRGQVQLGVEGHSSGKVLGTLTEEKQTFTVQICFSTGELVGYLDTTKVASMTVSVPNLAVNSGKTLTDWVKGCTTYVFNWYNNSNSSANDRALLIDDLKITVSSSTSEG